jgi:hypothetical protein
MPAALLQYSLFAGGSLPVTFFVRLTPRQAYRELRTSRRHDTFGTIPKVTETAVFSPKVMLQGEIFSDRLPTRFGTQFVPIFDF